MEHAKSIKPAGDPRPISGRRKVWPRLRSARLASIALAFLFATARADVYHYYDEIGRLIESVAPDGSVVQYVYDAAGNITAINRPAGSGVTIIDFTPGQGLAGTPVTVVGSGFSSPATSNTVKFNGTRATVTGGNCTGANCTSLQVTVPASATTGPILVKNGAGVSATSASNFNVTAGSVPTVTSFTTGAQGLAASIGNPGTTTLTINGTNFQTQAAADKATVGNTAATVLTNVNSPLPTTLQVTVPWGMPSGKVSVGTRYGMGTSATDFYAVPSGTSPTSVDFAARATIGGTGVTGQFTAAGRAGVVLFDGTMSSNGVAVLASNVTTSGSFWVFRQDGSVVGISNLFEGALIPVPAPGPSTFTIVATSGSAGSATFTVGGVDLLPSGLQVGTITANQDGSWSIPVSYNVTNAGTMTAQPGWADVAYVSVDNILSQDDLSPWGVLNYQSSLAPQSSYPVNNSFLIGNAQTPPGSYWVFVKADGHNAYTGGSANDNGNVVETNETNNAISQQVTLTRPDLQISGLSVPSMIANQDGSWTIYANYTVTNVGGADAQKQWNDIGYVSVDGILSNDDASASVWLYQDTLPVNHSYSPSGASFNIFDRNTSPGNYTLFVKTDGHNAATGGTNTDTGNLVELNENNNVASLPVTLSRPDLQISGYSIPSIISNHDGSWTIYANYTVTNIGGADAQKQWNDVGYVSTDQVLSNDDASASIWLYQATLPVNQYYSPSGASFNIFDRNTPEGTYYVFFKTDGHNTALGGTNIDGGNMVELNENNNLTSPMQVTLGRADLKASGLVESHVSNLDGSWTFTVSYNVKNVGTADAQANWADYAYVSTDATLSNDDTATVSPLNVWQQVLGVNQSYPVTNAQFTMFDKNTPTGNYTFFVKADGHNSYTGTNTDGGELFETNENNNLVSKSITLKRPDLQISGFSTGTVVSNADGSWSIPVTYTVTNGSTVSAPAHWSDVAYVSVDGTLSNDDFSPWGTVHDTGYVMAPNDSYQVSNAIVNFGNASTPNGNYTIFVKADGHNAYTGGTNIDTGSMVESNEKNNLASVQIYLQH